MKKHLSVLCGIFSFSSVCLAQSFSPAIISSAGGTNQTNAVSVDWTLGESAVQTAITPANVFTEGFHQPELKVIDVETASPVLNAVFNITVAPNPVCSILTVRLQSDKDEQVQLSMTDMNGKKLYVIKAASVDSKELDMSGLSEGMYLLAVHTMNGDLIKTYKISKIQ